MTVLSGQAFACQGGKRHFRQMVLASHQLVAAELYGKFLAAFEQVQLAAARNEIGRAHSELQSLMRISYAVFCLKKKKQRNNNKQTDDTKREINITSNTTYSSQYNCNTSNR